MSCLVVSCGCEQSLLLDGAVSFPVLPPRSPKSSWIFPSRACDGYAALVLSHTKLVLGITPEQLPQSTHRPSQVLPRLLRL